MKCLAPISLAALVAVFSRVTIRDARASAPPPPVSNASMPLFLAIHNDYGCASDEVDAFEVTQFVTEMCFDLTSTTSGWATCDDIWLYSGPNCTGTVNMTKVSDVCAEPDTRNITLMCMPGAAVIAVRVFASDDTTCMGQSIATQYALADQCMTRMDQPDVFFRITDVTNAAFTTLGFANGDCSGDPYVASNGTFNSCARDPVTNNYYQFVQGFVPQVDTTVSSTGGGGGGPGRSASDVVVTAVVVVVAATMLLRDVDGGGVRSE